MLISVNFSPTKLKLYHHFFVIPLFISSRFPHKKDKESFEFLVKLKYDRKINLSCTRWNGQNVCNVTIC